MKTRIVETHPPPPHFQAAAPARHPRKGPSMIQPSSTGYDFAAAPTTSFPPAELKSGCLPTRTVRLIPYWNCHRRWFVSLATVDIGLTWPRSVCAGVVASALGLGQDWRCNRVSRARR